MRDKKTKVINGDVYCTKCSVFLGAICDPFRPPCCQNCFKEIKASNKRLANNTK